MVTDFARTPTAEVAEKPSFGRDFDFAVLAWRLLCAFVASIPFSIFIAQTLLILTAVAAALDWWRRGRPRPSTPLDLPIACFLGASLLAAFFGLDLAHSLWGLRTYLQIVIVYLVGAYATDLDRAFVLVRCFLAGSAITATYTLLGALAPTVFTRLFLGQMTQSGQLLFAIGFTAPLLPRDVLPQRLVRPAFVLYVLALIVNLKRGAWFGVTAALITVAVLTSRRLLIATAAVILLVVATASPVRDRITNSTRDLFLPGNRYDIWAAAIDVVHRFPMGVGRKNGEILRDYANIPQHHKHAHNNVLQITMESGYLGLATFLWWMGRFAQLTWRGYRRVPPDEAPIEALAVAVLASFVGFHVAGLVEYNFGDSEVLEAFFVMMGLGLVVDRITWRDA